jgi:hypothetical protein
MKVAVEKKGVAVLMSIQAPVSGAQATLSRKLPRLFLQIDSSIAHALALSGFPVYVASPPLGSILLLS